ncbi:MAG TPA: ATP-binding protein [Opitutaceae bacterium]|nr:ATP-binding protein [Opitutaceae bacterium]
MKTRARATKGATALRRRAQAQLKEKQGPPVRLGSEAQVRRLVHELQVHQVELELQNEELKQAGLAAREAADKYTELYDFAPSGYFSLNRAGRITEANLTAASMLGLHRSRLVARSFERFVPKADQPAFLTFLGGVFERKAREHCEMTLQNAKGEPLEVRWNSGVSQSGANCRVAIVDISAQKRAERDKLILNQLESLGALAGGIAHDFNNLLAVILMSIEVAESQLEPTAAKTKGFLDEAIRAVFLAQGLTRKFISLTHGGTAEHKTVALAGLIHESVRIGLADSEVVAEFDLPDDLWAVKVDEAQIGQVIQNVVLNAREAMPAGGTVQVRAYNVTLEAARDALLPIGKYVCLSISDKGVGISKETLPKIFEPYYTTKSRGTQKGMGLGLTICHSIMQRHKGAITAQSKPGAGATLNLYFPVPSEE